MEYCRSRSDEIYGSFNVTSIPLDHQIPQELKERAHEKFKTRSIAISSITTRENIWTYLWYRFANGLDRVLPLTVLQEGVNIGHEL